MSNVISYQGAEQITEISLHIKVAFKVNSNSKLRRKSWENVALSLISESCQRAGRS